MTARVYECKKCGEKGSLDNGFHTQFIGKKKITRKIKHSCGGDSKWLKGERLYNHEKSEFLEEMEDAHGIYMGSYVRVKGLEKQGQMKVIGIKRGSRRKIWVEVWNPDTKFCWAVPVKNIKEVWNANDD